MDSHASMAMFCCGMRTLLALVVLSVGARALAPAPRAPSAILRAAALPALETHADKLSEVQ